ncbi:regulator of cell morphogenesis and NO signaling [Salirhabdus euzebyi]|uniref:Regulator of cell morphogenesis and NO signaling n=1 Tax=Salirhabdus euzebyi TaxID=394506 RepID=A0A841Q9C1_9BACI|nr:iron-sulfur cluster repair di-iron protein [Salirhabdus euzebyi]MBB6454842.1 regulator of cell morphogenesis and NO signaling [Salirhabdus euzebyi]
MYTITNNDTPANIIKMYPKASDIFKKYKIDFCCGGDKPLKEVVEKRKLQEDDILMQLNEGYDQWVLRGEQQPNWEEISVKDLIDYITDVHHSYLKEELPALSPLVTKVYRVHGNHHTHLKEVYRLYHELQMELEEHTLKEENEVFPLILEHEKQQLPEQLEKIKELEDEHDKAGQLLKQLREVTNDYTLPDGACNTYRITYERLRELEEDTFTHIHLENHVLFKKIID